MSRRLRYLSFLLASGVMLSAQTTGGLQGRVLDPKGIPVPGAKVSVSGAGIQGERVAVTDASGAFHLGLLPPGLITITVTKEGLNTIKTQSQVGLDKTATLELKMAAVAAAIVEVTDTSTAIDVKGTAVGSNFTSEVIQELPMSREMSSVANLAPGITQDREGIKVYGASGVENNWVVDGINTTNVEFGRQGKKVPMEFIQEFQVKTGGYEAEYGKSTGGVVNVLTKSGGNEFTGDLFYYYESKGLQATNKHANESLGGGAFKPLPVGYRTSDFGFDVGGYLIKDKLWFFVAYDKTNHSEDNQVQTGPALGVVAPTATETNLFSGKLTWKISDTQTLIAQFIGDPSTTDGAVKDPQGPKSTWDGTRKIGGTDLSLRYEVTGDSWFGRLQASRHRETNDTLGGIGADQVLVTNNSDQSQSGGFGRWDTKAFTRDNLTGSFSKFFDLAGHHEFKVGFDIQKDEATCARNYSGGQSIIDYGTYFDHQYWTTGDANNGVDASGNFVLANWNAPAITFRPNAKHNSEAFYVQDRWDLSTQLTLNVGLRLDQTDVLDKQGNTALSLRNEWAPRLGLIYDFKGRGQDKLYVSMSRFYEQLPMDLVIRSFNLERNPDVYNNAANSLIPDPTYGQPGILGGNEPVDRDVKGQYMDQFILGFETTVGEKYIFGAKYIRNYFGRVIEDSLDNSPDNLAGAGNYNIINPGLSHDVGLQYPKANRDFKGLEVTFQRKMADRYTYQLSYLWSELTGNYEGGYSGIGGATGTGQTDPNITAAFDQLVFTVNNHGALSGDRKHQFKANGAYEIPEWGLSIGASAFYFSGTPITRMGAADYAEPFGYSNRWELFLTPRGAEGRTPDTSQLDLNFVYTKAISNTVKLRAMVDITNVLDAQTTTQVDQRYNFAIGSGNFDPNPTFKRPIAYQLPRSIRLGIRFSF